MTGGDATTTTNLETVGAGAPSTTASALPIASSVGVNSPHLMPAPTQVAYLSQSDTTLTAYAVPGTTGLAILDGDTLTFRGEGVTLSDGGVVSLGFDGLVESTTTATYEPLTGVSLLLTSSVPLPTGPGPVIVNSSFPALVSSSTAMGAELTGSQSGSMVTATSPGSTTSGTAGGATGDASSSAGATDASASRGAGGSSSSQQAAATLSAGKVAILLSAVGGMVAVAI